MSKKLPWSGKKNVLFVGQLSPEELDRLKTTHGRIAEMFIPANDEMTEIGVGYFKPIPRELMGAALSVADPITSKQMVLEATFVAGDKRILEDDEMFYAACNQVDVMMSVRRGFLKKN